MENKNCAKPNYNKIKIMILVKIDSMIITGGGEK